MKKVIYLVCLLFIVKTAQAQLESRYEFGNAPPLLDECDALGNKTGKTFAPPAGSAYKITNTNGDYGIGTCLLYGELKHGYLYLKTEMNAINYLRYNCRSIDANKIEKKDTEEIKFKSKLESDFKKSSKISLKIAEEYRRYFLIKISDIPKVSTPLYQTGRKNKSFVVGTQAKLIKIRLKDFDFAKDFSLASTFGFRYRTSPKKDNFLSFVGSIGISLNDLDNNVAPKLADTAKIKNIGALTLGLGFIREYGKIQVSLMFGKDFLSKANQNKYNWIYNGKTWISFGVGIGIFTGDDGKKNSETDNQ